MEDFSHPQNTSAGPKQVTAARPARRTEAGHGGTGAFTGPKQVAVNALYIRVGSRNTKVPLVPLVGVSRPIVETYERAVIS